VIVPTLRFGKTLELTRCGLRVARWRVTRCFVRKAEEKKKVRAGVPDLLDLFLMGAGALRVEKF